MRRDTATEPPSVFESPTNTRASHRAARWIWWIGGAETVIFVFLAVILVVLASISIDESFPEFEGQLDLVLLQARQDRLWSLVALLLVLGVGPGLAYLWLGFAIRRGALTAIRIALAVVGTQVVVLALVMVNVILTAILALDPFEVSLSVVLLGTPAALLVCLVRVLLRAQADRMVPRFIAADPAR